MKVLGKGCPKCTHLEELAREAAADAGVEATFTHVTDMDGILTYDVMATLGLVIDGGVKSSSRIPRKEDILTWMPERRGL
jgi:small redox-active disulfide protein 2